MPTVVHALTQPRAAKIEPQHWQPKARKRLGRVIHHLGMHGAAAGRMRMRHNRRIYRILLAGIQNSLQKSSRPAQVGNTLHMGSKCSRITHTLSLASSKADSLTSVILTPDAIQDPNRSH